MKKSILKYILLLVLAATMVFAMASCDILASVIPEGILPEGLLPDSGDPSDDPADDPADDPSDDPTEEPGDNDQKVPDVSGIVFEGKTVTYDGKYHELAIDADKLPAGVAVLYTTNKYMNAGEYTVTADFYWAGKKIEGASKSATLTINKASVDVSGLTLPGLTKTYDGNAATVEVAGKIPAGVSVSYVYKNAAGEEVEAAIDAGSYTAWAVFNVTDSKNFHPVSPISSEIEIRKAKVSGISFADARFDYDGTAKSIYITGNLPGGVTVSYEGNGQTEKGSYTVTASFTVNGNYEPIAPMTATLQITKLVHDMSGVSLLGKTVTYDGNDHMIGLTGTLPEGVAVTIFATDADGNVVTEIVNVGTYTVTAKFTVDAAHESIDDIVATVTVNKAVIGAISFADQVFGYDGTAKSIYITGNLPDGVTVSYEGNGQTAKGVYTVTAIFSVTGNYEPIDPMTATMTIETLVHDMSGVSLNGATVSYDGTNHMIGLTGTLPEGVGVTYIITDANGNVVTDIVNAGIYTVTAKFSVAITHEPIEDMVATVTVNKAVVSGLSFADQVLSYNGAEQSIYVAGLPAYVTVTYSGNGKSAPGVYTVTATFTTDDNIEPIAPMTATMTIELGNPLDHPTATLTYEKVSGGYSVTGITNAPSIMVIPATYEGQPVVSIASNAFRGMTALEYVYIPETVHTVGNAAFYGCTSLATLYLADFSVSVNGQGETVTVGASALKLIGQKAFARTAITVVDLPDSVTTIGYAAFEGCNSITKMTLPFIGGSVATSHAYLGYLFGSAAAETSISFVPATLKEIIISDNCTEIPAFAFYGLTSLEKVYVGRSVAKIGNGAFYGCSSIRDMYLPASVVTIPANAFAANSPFYGCASDFMLVIEDVASTAAFGLHYCAIADGVKALVVFNKSYEDYVMNKESYRIADPTDSSAAAIYTGDSLIGGFAPDNLNYTVEVDINKGYPEISVLATSSAADVVVSAIVNNVMTVTITSLDGSSVTTYTITFNVVGTFASTSEVVGKDGSKGTVSFVIDDGYEPAANFSKKMLAKYPNLALNFAIYTKHFGTLTTEDSNGDGIPEFVKDADGNYTYTVNTAKVDFWRDIVTSAQGRTEILPHSHDHGFWGMNDEGGLQVTVSNRSPYNAGYTNNLPEGGSTSQIWAAQQIISDIFGDLGFKGITYVTPGIVKCTGPKDIGNDLTIKFNNSAVRLVYDTAVSSAGGTITVNSDTTISLQSVNVVIPAGAEITTIAEFTDNVIPAGTVVRVVSGSVVLPAGTNVLGYGDYYDALYEVAYDEGLMIAARNTGASGTSSKGYYTKDYFTTKEHRLLQRSFGVSVSSSTTEADVDGWVSHIDNAVSKGVWVSYCIHNILTPETATGNYILEEYAERLFKQAADYGDDIWIATYTEATMYYHEWSSATVTSSYDEASETVSVSLTDNERDDIYTMPLTIKASVPSTWSYATVGAETLEVYRNADGSAYVLVNVVPETTVVLSH